VSFKLFIYYCALCGGWAAFLTWAIVQGAGIRRIDWVLLRATLSGGLLGMFVAGAVGLVDALLNAVGTARFGRVGICMGLGLLAGMFGGLVGQGITSGLRPLMPTDWVGDVLLLIPITFGWVLAGVLIGATIGAFDLLRAVTGQQDMRAPIKKVVNGVIGGVIGGIVGGFPFAVLQAFGERWFPRSNLTMGFVIFGLCIGLLIGLAQVILKEAWIKVLSGFRAGRELMLSKDETIIGRAESCDLGLFGDASVQKKHAAIVLKNNRYMLSHIAEEGETYLNDQLVTRPTPLKSGDEIRVGKSVLQFGERQKRKN
jgi:hypothetical protein